MGRQREWRPLRGTTLALVDEDTTMHAYHLVMNGWHLNTAGMDRISFKAPGKVGDRLLFRSDLIHVGKTSLTFQATVLAERHNELRSIFQGLAMLVAINDHGEPTRLALRLKVEKLLPDLQASPL
jgi:acyl-CoA hydrolase